MIGVTGQFFPPDGFVHAEEADDFAQAFIGTLAATSDIMLLATFSLTAAFIAGFGLMVRELLKAPVAYQDEEGFHAVTNETDVKPSRTAHARVRRVRRQLISHAGMKGFEPAHAR